MSDNYDASKIIVLEGLEGVRKRPAMYIGSTGKAGLHQLAIELISNSVDEGIAGYANHITITLHDDGSLSVRDNGRGLPVDKHKQTNVSAMETIMTNLHAGGKFDGGAYKVSGGLHGVGMKCVNALSTWMRTISYKDGFEYMQEYAQGKKTSEVTKVGATSEKGTLQRYLPDPTIFKETVEYDFEEILKLCRSHAYLTAGLRFTVRDERVEEGKKPLEYNLYFEDGVKSYVQFLNIDEKIVGDACYVNGELDDVVVEVGLQYNDTMNENVKCYTNNIFNPDGGTHLVGFRAALTMALNSYGKDKELLKGVDGGLSGDDVREGLTAVISVKVGDPQFEGQTKTKLNNPEVKSIVQKVVKDSIDQFLAENPATAKAIVSRAVLANKARAAAKAARDAVVRKGALEGGGLPGKLADCSSKNAEECELFLVEGDSAGGSAKQGRDRGTQAILPMRGKVINTQKYRVDRVLGNNEIKDIVTALGVGIGDSIDTSKLRYHKLILMCDADVDGQHITTLVLTMLFKFFRTLIEQGYVYVAQPPLFKVEVGKQRQYFVNNAEMESYASKVRLSGKKPVINRFKGLGEMNPEQLWETTMNPETRALKRVTIHDAEEAEKVFEMLMGEEVPPRRRFIQNNAKRALIDA